MLDKLKMFEKIQKRGGWDFADQQDSSVTNISLNQPLRNCQSIQQQLDRLKELMENVFSVANENRPTNSNCQTDVRRNNQVPFNWPHPDSNKPLQNKLRSRCWTGLNLSIRAKNGPVTNYILSSILAR